MLKELLDAERLFLDHFFENCDLEAVEKLLDILKACEGILIFTGVGNSALIAEKIAVTMTSTGTRAVFLSPDTALHGDIGIATNKDVCVVISKSGETDELVNLIPFLRRKGVKMTCIVNNLNSRVAKACDFALGLPIEKELGPHDLAPTTSTTMQMIVGDVLAISLMLTKNITLDQYAMNHPAGRIGRRIFTKVMDLMIIEEGIPLCPPDQLLVDTLVELSDKRCGCVLIVDEEQKLLGIFTDGDLRRTLLSRGSLALETKMKDLMTQTPRWIDRNALAFTALQLMESDQNHPIMVLPVLDEEKRVVGIIKMHDIVQSGL